MELKWGRSRHYAKASWTKEKVKLIPYMATSTQGHLLSVFAAGSEVKDL